MDIIKGKNILVFDLETTGLPYKKNGHNLSAKDSYYDYRDNSKYNSSRIVQIGWTYIENYSLNCSYEVKSYIISPNGYNKIDNSHIHGITYDEALKTGIKLIDVLTNGFYNCLKNTDYIIAHNAFFDVSILMNEFYRNKLFKSYNILNNLIKENKILCTMEHSVDLCKLPFKNKNIYRKYKMPKLCELHKIATGKEPIMAHTADSDVNSLINILHSNYFNIEKNIVLFNKLEFINNLKYIQNLDRVLNYRHL